MIFAGEAFADLLHEIDATALAARRSQITPDTVAKILLRRVLEYRAHRPRRTAPTLSSADAAAAQPIAERIRKRVADVRVEGFGIPISVTCSIGVATSDMLGVWGEPLIARTDEAVYAARRSGRNRVQLAALAA